MITVQKIHESYLKGPSGTDGVRGVSLEFRDETGWRHVPENSLSFGAKDDERAEIERAIPRILEAFGKAGEPWEYKGARGARAN